MEPQAIDFASKAMYLVLILSLPPIIVASIVGLFLSLFQAVTQLQEQTLSFAVKLIAVIATMSLIYPWMSAEIIRFGLNIFDNIHLF
jgi:type III secretion protein S